ncbi:PAS domain S-box protein [Vulcaniibacterium gelatinicum]|uniref:PAS domain S-box protein n=1 Tax=Vulcaniibacterium gelatinicum TaxID=2598725 RepID=UPI0015F2D5B8|nr:PAS domain S-box protein [Vulcaniibacterium gelatinicum]
MALRLAMHALWLLRAAALVLPLSAVIAWQAWRGIQELTAVAGAASLNLARQAAAQYDARLADTDSMLRSLGRRPGIATAAPGQCDPLLRELPGLLSTAALDVAVTDAAGRWLCSARPAAALPALRFADAGAGHGLAVSEPARDPASGRWVLALARTFPDAGGRRLLLLLDLEWLGASLPDGPRPEGAVITLVSADARLLARVPPLPGSVGHKVQGVDAVVRGRALGEGVFSATGLDGIERVYAVAPVPRAGWQVYAGLPERALMAPVRRHALELGGVLALLALLVLAWFWRMRRSMGAARGMLVAAAQAMGAGGGPVPLRPGGPQELQQAAEAFNCMLEARARLEDELATQTNLLRGIVDAVADAIVVMDTERRIRLFNPAAERLFGYHAGEVSGRNVSMLMPPPYRDEHDGYVERYLRTGERRIIGIGREVHGLRRDGEAVPLDLAINEFSAGGERLFVAVLRDLRPQRQAEAERRASELRWRLAVEGADIGLWDWDLASGRVYYSPTWKRQLGYRDDEIGDSVEEWRSRVHPDDLAGAEARMQELLARPVADFQSEFRMRHCDGGWRWILARGAVLLDAEGRPQRVLGVHVDITALRRSEQQLREARQQAQALARRLVALRDDEQRRLAAELHDRIGQNLTALSLALGLIEADAAGRADRAAKRLHDARSLLEATIAAVRDLITELRPVVLDDYGLLTALRWYGEQLGRRTGLVIQVEGDDARPGPAVEATLFRIAQEALINAAKHAQATSARVRLRGDHAALRLEVADDGIGFDPAALHPGEGSHLGLVLMRERAEALGARLHVDSAPGRGTRVVVEWNAPA